MSNDIKHIGIIEHINDGHIQVRIEQSAACAGCRIAHSCHAAESKEKLIDIYSSNKDLQIGQQVMVSTSTAIAYRAVLIGFAFPLIVMLAVLFAAKLSGISEPNSALLSIASLIPSYLLVWFFRNRLKEQIQFKLEEYNHI
jgi:sigma-E factor negative regulatory protein RseC